MDAETTPAIGGRSRASVSALRDSGSTTPPADPVKPSSTRLISRSRISTALSSSGSPHPFHGEPGRSHHEREIRKLRMQACASVRRPPLFGPRALSLPPRELASEGPALSPPSACAIPTSSSETSRPSRLPPRKAATASKRPAKRHIGVFGGEPWREECGSENRQVSAFERHFAMKWSFWRIAGRSSIVSTPSLRICSSSDDAPSSRQTPVASAEVPQQDRLATRMPPPLQGKTRAPAPFAIEPFRLRLQVQIELLAGPRTVRIAEASSLGAKRCGNPCRPDIDGPGDAAGDGPDTHLRQELGQPCERNPLQAQMQGFSRDHSAYLMPPCSARSSARPEAKAVLNWKSIFNGLGSTAADATHRDSRQGHP